MKKNNEKRKKEIIKSWIWKIQCDTQSIECMLIGKLVS